MISIFNDVIGPVMRGPSSSHCAAALRIGRIARDLMEGEVGGVLVEFDRNGSLPTTHESQGSDMGLCGGLLGWEAADERLPESVRALRAAGVRFRIEIVDAGDPHPNTYRLTLHNAHEQHTLVAVSTGGGMIEVVALDGVEVSVRGDCHETFLWVEQQGARLGERIAASMAVDRVLVHDLGEGQLVEVKASRFVAEETLAELRRGFAIRVVKRLSPVLPVPWRKGASVPFTTCAELLRCDGERNRPLWEWAVAYESERGGMGSEEVQQRMVAIVRILRRSIRAGVAGTAYADRILGHQCGKFDELQRAGRLLDGGLLNRIVLNVSALMEVKSAMGVIVAAPTAGACAALPGAVIGAGEGLGAGEQEMARALLASGLIGVFIATRWTFAAEVGGCQAEGGAASSMAAAALVTLVNGSLAQSVAAASMAFQNMLGLICDPVANRVEAPCLGKNVMAASNALACANLALADYDPLIPLDEVIDAARAVAAKMPREHRCTGLGGLSITPSSMAIQRRLACGSCPPAA